MTFHQPKRDNTPIPQPIPQNCQSNHDVCVRACARSCHKHPAAHLRIVRRVLPVHMMYAERHVLVEQGATLSAPGPRHGGVGKLLREEQAIAGPALQPPQWYLWWPAPATHTAGRRGSRVRCASLLVSWLGATVMPPLTSAHPPARPVLPTAAAPRWKMAVPATGSRVDGFLECTRTHPSRARRR
jgi:hypothetical protein